MGGDLTPEEQKARLESLQEAAANGDASAQVQLGRAYQTGELVEVDYDKANPRKY